MKFPQLFLAQNIHELFVQKFDSQILKKTFLSDAPTKSRHLKICFDFLTNSHRPFYRISDSWMDEQSVFLKTARKKMH